MILTTVACTALADLLPLQPLLPAPAFTLCISKPGTLIQVFVVVCLFWVQYVPANQHIFNLGIILDSWKTWKANIEFPCVLLPSFH